MVRLAPSPRRPADFVILSAMRSGSGNLQDSLSRHPEIDCGAEVFNPVHLQIWARVYMEERATPVGLVGGARAFMAIARHMRRRFPGMMLRLARRPRGKPLFGFRLFGDHIAYFGLEPFLDDLRARGTRFLHLVRRDTFDQAVSLVRAQATGVWKIGSGAPVLAPPVDLLALADRIGEAAERLQSHKLVSATVARRLGALLVDYDEYTRDEGSYDRIQEFLGVRSRVALRHVNRKSPPVKSAVYARLREELERRRVPTRFDPDAT